MAKSPEDKETDIVRQRIRMSEEFWSDAWSSGTAGKVGVVVAFGLLSLPFWLDLGVAYFAWVHVWPLASGVSEKIGVLAFLAFILTAIAYQVRGATTQLVTGVMLTRD